MEEHLGKSNQMDSQMDVVGVRVEMPSNQPIVLLKESDGKRFLPIWIGAVEATAIAFAQQGVEPPRPLTHDLLKEIISATGNSLQKIFLSDIKDGVFFAELVFANGVEVSARPSDAIALALRTNSPIYASSPLLEQAGIEINESGEEDEGEVERFREFLDQIDPEDFAI